MDSTQHATRACDFVRSCGREVVALGGGGLPGNVLALHLDVPSPTSVPDIAQRMRRMLGLLPSSVPDIA
eukprot:609797-Rhodomonas_salina.2